MSLAASRRQAGATFAAVASHYAIAQCDCPRQGFPGRKHRFPVAEKTISPVTYALVLLALVALTVLTVGLSFLHVRGVWHVVMGVSIAVAKAGLVALFFMHLVHSRPATRAVVIVALFWLSVVFMSLTFSDYGTRGWFPFAPGH